jgi:NAD(P)-dependent dehydrogenase (short-subunit alcohol dehydrogenase family)
VSLASLILREGPSGFGFGTTAEQVTAGLDLTGTNVLVTGATSGLGEVTVRVLAERGARIFAAARTADRAEALCRTLAGAPVPVPCDLADPVSVLACVDVVTASGARLDAIICNAGIMALPRLELVHGYEKQFFTNHMGHFLLVTRLLPRLAERGRVVMVSSDAHRMAPRGGIDFENLSGQRSYNAWTAYGRSKIANLLFAKALARRLPHGQCANAVHPGVIITNLQRSMTPLMRTLMRLGQPLFMKTAAQGAATQCYVAVHPSMTENGEYFADCNVRQPRRAARDLALAEKLWQVSERIVSETGGGAA